MTTKPDHDFASLRQLLALQKAEMPQDTQIDEFLVEFHRRQRAQLLVSPSLLARTFGRTREWLTGLAWAPSLSYLSAAAAVALVAFVGFSPQVQVAEAAGPSKLSFRMPSSEMSFAMVPGALVPASKAFLHVGDSPAFAPSRTTSAATRYVLATNSHGAYDATVAF